MPTNVICTKEETQGAGVLLPLRVPLDRWQAASASDRVFGRLHHSQKNTRAFCTSGQEETEASRGETRKGHGEETGPIHLTVVY